MEAASTIDVEGRFAAMQAALAGLVADGYARNADGIRRILAAAVEDDLWLRRFIESCVRDRNHRVLCSAQSFPVLFCDTHAIRVNLWFPIAGFSESVNRIVDEYFSIDVCHNHSFDFFTVGALGPGYLTTFHETSEAPLRPKAGDRMQFARTWSFRLEKGTAVFVPAGTHFHVQHAPEAFSVSLNLIPKKQECGELPQVILSTDQLTVDRVIRR